MVPYCTVYESCTAYKQRTLILSADINPKCWISCFFPRPHLGKVTSNTAESATCWILQERGLTWFSCLSDVVRKNQVRCFNKREQFEVLSGTNVPWVLLAVKQLSQESRKRLLAQVADHLVEVQRNSSSSYAVVDTYGRACSCGAWRKLQYPCIHACVAIIFRKEDPAPTYQTTTPWDVLNRFTSRF